MLDFTNTTANDWNFALEEITPEVGGIPVEGYKALRRADTGEVLKIHPDSYTVLPHDDVVNAAYDAVKEANLSSDFSVDVQCLNSGRQLKGTILFNDLTIEPAVGDHVKLEMQFFNSYDGSWAYSNQLAGLRLVCTNGMVTPQNITRTWQRHTSQISTVGNVAQLARGMDMFMSNKEEWQRYMKVKVERQQCEEFFKSTLVKRRSKSSDERHNMKQLDVLMGQLDEEFATLGRNQWALYNCLTHWSSHTAQSSNPAAQQRSREGKVAAAMNSKFWKELA